MRTSSDICTLVTNVYSSLVQVFCDVKKGCYVSGILGSDSKSAVYGGCESFEMTLDSLVVLSASSSRTPVYVGRGRLVRSGHNSCTALLFGTGNDYGMR
jgi:hypothetical protein